MKYVLRILLIVVPVLMQDLYAQNMALAWAKSVQHRPSPGWFKGISILSHTTDSLGNIYMTGYFSDSVDFDPGPGNYFMKSKGDGDAFVMKMDAQGGFVWAKQIMGSDESVLFSFETGFAIDLDPSGNIVVGGMFYDTVDFDPGVGVYNLVATGITPGMPPDAFVLKLDNDGNFIWALSFGNDLGDQVYALNVDARGGYFLNGSFWWYR